MTKKNATDNVEKRKLIYKNKKELTNKTKINFGEFDPGSG
jgi:hypothetical protein